MRTENWNGHRIRFIEINGEWLAYGKDATDALGYANGTEPIKYHVDPEDQQTVTWRAYNNSLEASDSSGTPSHRAFSKTLLASDIWGESDYSDKTFITEGGIYDLVAGSHLPEAKKFKHWTHDIIKELRQSIGLGPTQVFTMMDVEHQKAAMAKVQAIDDKKVNFIKANQITNKAVANMYGLPKLITKHDMTPAMLIDREKILDEVVELMTMKEKYGLDISVSEIVYSHQHVKITLPVKKGVTK